MPTREGTTLLLLAGAIFLLATNLASGLLFVLDALLVSLLVVGAATSFLPLRRMVATRRAPVRGTEGAPVPIEITLSAAHSGRFLSVEDGWIGARARALVAAVAPGVPATTTLTVVPWRRGQFTIGPADVSSRGTVGLFVARRRIEAPDRIAVWPQVRPVAPQVIAQLAPSLGERPSGDRTRQPDDLYGVREYQRGDSLARIHWRSSARRGALVVRQFESTRAVATTIVIDLDRRQSPDRLDAAVRAAASVLRLARDHRTDVIVAGWEEGLVERRGWEAAMDWLAGVIPCGPPVADVLPALATSGRRLIVVAAVAQPTLPADVTSIVPAEDITAQQGAYDGLVYTADGTVLAW
ncbi:MAG: DUF58 domain-containing protein [Armatimonadota bacterium]